MKVFQNAFEAGRVMPGSVVAIGKFDGMHLGHQKVLATAVKHARKRRAKTLVVTFHPHPQEYFHPGSYKPIFSLEQRLILMAKMGVDAALLLPFNHALTCQAPEAFTRDILVQALKVAAVYVGPDFCFGKDRAGTVRTLAELGPDLGFTVHSVPLVRVQGERVSSERIRELLEQGLTAKAESYLGRPLNEGQFPSPNPTPGS